MGKVLITGADSAIGGNLALTLAKQFDCLALYQGQRVAPADCDAQPCDLAKPAQLLQIVQEAAPDWVIHCGSLANNAWEPCNAHWSPQDEVELVRQLSAATAKMSCALTVLSSDGVFVGPRLFHEESCVPTGQSPLAQHARRMEEALKGTHALVVRTHAYGWSSQEHVPNWVESIALRLLDGEAIALDGVRYATPILASDLAEFLAQAFALKLTGLLQITGAERTNAFRFVRELALSLGIESYSLPSPEAMLPAGKIPVLETSLNTRRARRDLGCAMPLLREGLERFAAQRADGYLDALRAGSQHPLKTARAA